MEELETPTTTTTTTTNNGETAVSNDPTVFFDDVDSACSTPYVSAPSSPGRGPSPPSFRFFYSAPASPVHFIPTSSPSSSPPPSVSKPSASSSSEFEFSAKPATADNSAFSGDMSSADELFLNGKIRPMKLQRPPRLAPLIDVDEYETSIECDDEARGRDLDLRDRSIRRRTRSMSPLRTTSSFEWCKSDDQSSSEIEQIGLNSSKQGEEASMDHEVTSASGSSSRSSSAGRNTKRWIFLKDLLYRSKSEGRSDSHRYFWSSVSFSPIKDRKSNSSTSPETMESAKKVKQTARETTNQTNRKPVVAGKVMNGIGKRPSPHELHYTANRAQAEEMRKKTFLPYRQGLFGFLGFGSKSSNGAMNTHHGYARPLNPVSSR